MLFFIITVIAIFIYIMSKMDLDSSEEKLFKIDKLSKNGLSLKDYCNCINETHISYEAIKAAVMSDGMAIQYCLNRQSPELQMIAIKNDALSIVYIQYPTIETQRWIIQNFPYYIDCISHLNKEIELEAVRQTPDCILELNHPRRESLRIYSEWKKMKEKV